MIRLALRLIRWIILEFTGIGTTPQITVNLITGRVIYFESVHQSKLGWWRWRAKDRMNRRFVYIQLSHDLATMYGKEPYYKQQDLVTVKQAAVAAAHRYKWPRQWKWTLLTIPLALSLHYTHQWPYAIEWLWLIALLPGLIKKPRLRVNPTLGLNIRDAVLEGMSRRVLSTTDVTRVIQEQRVIFYPTTIIVLRPGFFE